MHLVSHGQPGAFFLNQTQIDADYLAHQSDRFRSLGRSLAPGADVLIYGCNVGAGPQGEAFVQQLAELTGAHVAASTDFTGAAALKGNWSLERTTGTIHSSLPWASDTVENYSTLLPAFTETFSTDPTGGIPVVSFTRTLGGQSFTFTFTSDGDGGNVIYDAQNGASNSASIFPLSGAVNQGTTEKYTIRRTDNADFVFTSIFVNNAFNNGASVTVGGYKAGVLVGSTQTLAPAAAAATLSFGNIVVDEVRITSTDININIDDFSGNTTVNAAPVATTSGGTTAFTEGNNVTSTPVVIDSGITVSDSDNATLASGTVSITGNFQSAQDALAFTNNPATMGNISGSYNSGTGVFTLTSSGASATVAQWQAALRSVTYTNSSNSPNTSTRTISFVVNDGVASSSTATKSVSVTAVNDTPIVTASGGTTAFTESNNGSPVPVVIDGGVTVSDLDNSTLASATVSITGNFQQGEDVLGFTNNGSTMGNITGSYNATTGVLTLTSAGATASIAQWQAALRVVNFTPNIQTPTTATRTISFAVSDGTTTSSSTTKSVTVALVDDSPVGTASGGTTAFTEGNNVTSTPVTIDSGFSVSDEDTATLASATVSITGNFQASEDVLGFTNNGSTMGNISGSYNAGTGVLTLTSAGATATLAQWEAAVRSITYIDTSETPTPANRTISFVFNDGNSDSSATTKTVSISAVNDTPIVTATGGTTAFTEGNNVTSTPVVIDGGVSVSDLDNSTFASGTVSITSGFQSGQDVVAFTNDGSTMGNISGSYNSGTGVLTLTSAGATATVGQWQAALHAVTYTNSSESPNTATRTISFVVNDGATNSSASTQNVSVTSVDDSPTNILLSSASVGQSAGTNATVGTLSSTDVDSVSFTYSLVSGAGSTDNGSFNLSGATLRANDASALTPGSYSVRVRTTDGVSTPFEKVFSITATDDVAPAAPSTPDLAAASDTGTSSTDDLTNVTTPTFTGTAEANSTVELFRAGTLSLGTTTADGSGNWSLTLGTPLTAGIYSITAKATDASNNTSTASSALSITLDTTAPGLPLFTAISNDTGASSTDQITSDPTLILSGTAEANSVVAVTLVGVGPIGTANANGSGNWSFDYTATTLSAGDHIFRAIATDAAGNSSSVSADFLVTIDASAPSQVVISSISSDTGSSATDGITGDQTLTFSGTAEANATVTLNRTGVGVIGTATANGSGNWTFNYTGTTLPEGSYIFTAISSDSAGNVSTVSAAFPVTIDLTAPAAPVFTAISTDNGTSTTDQITSDATLILSGTTEPNASVTVTRVGTGVIGTATADGAGAWSFDYTATTLSIGTHLFTATTADVAGNIGPASGNFTVTVQTAPGISTQPAGGTYTVGDPLSLSVVATGTGPFTYQWYRDGVALTDGGGRSGSTSATFTETAVSASTSAGNYTVVASNLSGSVTSAVAAVVVNKLNQTITFPQPGTGTVGVRMVISATSSSGLPVTFSVISGSGSFATATQFIPLQPGPVVVRATQAGNATYSAATAVDRTINAVIAAPRITTQPVGGTVIEGGNYTLSAAASSSGLSYQWMFNGVPIPGANQATLTLTGAMLTQQGSYSVVVTNSTGSATSNAVDVLVQINNRLSNLSSRMRAGTGSKTAISGFIISGTAQKTVVIRGVGPGLTQFGVPGALTRPSLQLFNSAGTKIGEAVEWGKQSNVTDLTAMMQQLGMFTLAPADSAMLVSLDPGAYTVMINGATGETGVSLVEIYDAAPTLGRLINISTRGEVGVGSDVLIAGFIVSGASSKQVLIRAVGPGLTAYGVTGVLANPALRLYSANGGKLAENDNWEDTDGGAAVSAATTAAAAIPLPSKGKDAAITITLPPGAYTAHCYGVDAGTGVAIVEVYELP